jgi:putative SOS response-associated peptidase YedK
MGMCGRFSQHWEVSEWNELWPADWHVQEYLPRYNVGPGTAMLAIVHDAADHAVGGMMHWGIKTPRTFLINARAETASSRPTFRPLLDQGRLVVPMNGYYEWHQQSRTPFYIFRSQPVWALGLYHKTADGPRAVILTRAATASLVDIHARMPVFTDRETAQEWLTRSKPRYEEVLERLLSTEPAVQFHAVSRRVNKATNEGPELIAPAG